MRALSPHTADPQASQDLFLVRNSLAGGAEALHALLLRLGCIPRFVLRLDRALGYRLPTESLEGVVQQVYAAIWQRLADYSGSASLESWVFAFCRDSLRAEGRRAVRGQRRVEHVPDFELVMPDLPDPGRPGFEAREELEALRDELDRLAPIERQAVEMRHLQGCSFEEIGRRLGLAASTVKDRCYRALLRLHERLRRRDVRS